MAGRRPDSSAGDVPWPRQDTDEGEYELPKPTSALLSLDRVDFTTLALYSPSSKTRYGLSMTQAALQTTATSHCHQRASAWAAWWSVDRDEVTCRSTSVQSRVLGGHLIIYLATRLLRILTRHSARHRPGWYSTVSANRCRRNGCEICHHQSSVLEMCGLARFPTRQTATLSLFGLRLVTEQSLTPAASPFSDTFSASTCILPLLLSFLHRALLRATLNDRTIMLTVAQL